MDTSKEYVKMCYKARELQTKNFFQLIAERDTIQEYETELGGVATQLYRQDQLQDILFKDSPNPLDKDVVGNIARFDIWCRQNWIYGNSTKDEVFTTMEQLWLAFTMKEKYNKKWNGEDWVKNE